MMRESEDAGFVALVQKRKFMFDAWDEKEGKNP